MIAAAILIQDPSIKSMAIAPSPAWLPIAFALCLLLLVIAFALLLVGIARMRRMRNGKRPPEAHVVSSSSRDAGSGMEATEMHSNKIRK
jgi:hypothetical protein